MDRYIPGRPRGRRIGPGRARPRLRGQRERPSRLKRSDGGGSISLERHHRRSSKKSSVRNGCTVSAPGHGWAGTPTVGTRPREMPPFSGARVQDPTSLQVGYRDVVASEGSFDSLDHPDVGHYQNPSARVRRSQVLELHSDPLCQLSRGLAPVWSSRSLPSELWPDSFDVGFGESRPLALILFPKPRPKVELADSSHLRNEGGSRTGPGQVRRDDNLERLGISSRPGAGCLIPGAAERRVSPSLEASVLVPYGLGVA
jgi:hypothetical protein